MLLEVDAKALEWRIAAQLSQDPMMIREILEGLDIHEQTRQKMFKGKVERVLAKIFNFRFLFCDETTGAYAFNMDPKMPKLGHKEWERVIQRSLDHYSGLYRWHQQLYRDVCKEGELVGGTGRYWKFNKFPTANGLGYKRAQVYNYVVQGTSADCIFLATWLLREQIRQYNLTSVRLINCVHDSLIYDVEKKDLDKLVEVCYTVFHNLGQSMSEWFGIPWSVPLDAEVKLGPSWGLMAEVGTKDNTWYCKWSYKDEEDKEIIIKFNGESPTEAYSQMAQYWAK